MPPTPADQTPEPSSAGTDARPPGALRPRPGDPSRLRSAVRGGRAGVGLWAGLTLREGRPPGYPCVALRAAARPAPSSRRPAAAEARSPPLSAAAIFR